MADVNMQPLIDYLRRYGNAAADDVFNGETYWTDDQLEEVLLTRGSYGSITVPKVLSGVYVTPIPKHYWLRSDFIVKDSTGTVINTADYTYKPLEGSYTFSTPPAWDSITVEGFFVHIWDALADLWDRKAAQRTDYINFRAGQNLMNNREEYEHCVKQRDYYRAKTVRRWSRG